MIRKARIGETVVISSAIIAMSGRDTQTGEVIYSYEQHLANTGTVYDIRHGAHFEKHIVVSLDPPNFGWVVLRPKDLTRKKD